MTPTARRRESFRRSDRLRESAAYQRCYREGRRRGGQFLLFYVRREAGDPAPPRFGQTASRKVGSAVVRHRLKRWGREAFRRFPRRAELPAGDIVVHYRPEAARADFVAVTREIERQLEGLLARGGR